MRLSLRIAIPIMLILITAAYGAVPAIDAITLKWFVRDVDIRARLLGRAMEATVEPMVDHVEQVSIEKYFNRIAEDERIYAIGFCDTNEKVLAASRAFPKAFQCSESIGPDSSRMFHIARHPIQREALNLGELVIIHDLKFAHARSADARTYVLYFFGALVATLSFTTALIAQVSVRGWVKSLRRILRGDGADFQGRSTELKPLVQDLESLMHDLRSERRTQDESRITWSPKTLKEILNRDLAGEEVLIVSNREPYIHVKRDGQIDVQVPASGLVTALEPIMRACSGTWIAHGSGSGDREVVDRHDRVPVPPENPSYQIRRVWLTEDEEKGYYYGFANEGLWALCHIAHVRPIFRSDDWRRYKAVNEKFADTVVEEAKTDDPVILVQDYHFALLPKMIRSRLPKATVITFWHIPFPNSEVFGICPWREEILEGLLGSSILGFHTRFHCNNFMGAVDRFLECRIDRESSTISHKGELTAINPYPISIEFPSQWLSNPLPVEECRRRIRDKNHLSSDIKIGIGLDRLDYTKGVLERFRAVERLLELEPQWVGRFVFLQIAAPSRSSIDQYRHFENEVRELADRINNRFGNEKYQPILLKVAHHGPQDVYEYYRGADLCFVSSLHDGMNLVAKEFVSARDDEQGVLILSQFTGAARELLEAILVNPYNVDQCAAALHLALIMPHAEQRDRVRSMRGLIKEYNVYRWAGRMLIDAARLRQRTRLHDRLQDPVLNEPQVTL